VRGVVIVMAAFPRQRPHFVGATETRRQQRQRAIEILDERAVSDLILRADECDVGYAERSQGASRLVVAQVFPACQKRAANFVAGAAAISSS
jgi:hypothetical protein